MPQSRSAGAPLLLLVLAAGCPADNPSSGTGTDTESGGIEPTTAASMSTTTAAPPADSGSDDAQSSSGEPVPDGSTTADPPSDSSSGAAESGSGDDGPIIPETPTMCGNTIYECGDKEDNDGDGFFDLNDPECTGPCDDDEGSFQTGIPGDNSDCHQDCFFDGDSGSGNDGCLWDLTCDPANPGANINCEYNPGNNCNNSPPNQSTECIEFCTQFLPPGCDCFGCCEVTLEDGSTVGIFLNSGPDCSLQNLDACQSCTLNKSCFDPCVPEDCELCFGQTELPEGCNEVTCDNGLPCQVNEDCPTDFFCLQDCCYPPPPG